MYKKQNLINAFSNIELNDEDYLYVIDNPNHMNPTIYHPKTSKHEDFENMTDFDVEYKYYKSTRDDIDNNYARFARDNFNMILRTSNDNTEKNVIDLEKQIEYFQIDTSKRGDAPSQIIGIPSMKANKLYFGLSCDYLKDDSFYNALKQEGFKPTNNAKDACLVVPCSYENTENEIEQ